MTTKHWQRTNSCFCYDGVAVLVSGRAATEQPERFIACVPDLVPAARWYGDGIAGFDLARFVSNAHPASAGGDIVNLLGLRVVMFQCAAAGRHARLRQALVADERIAMSEQLANLRAVLRGEGGHFIEVFHVHILFPVRGEHFPIAIFNTSDAA